MEIKFQSNKIRSLSCCADRILTQEQTQEVKLSDGMPDIGRVLGAWGRPVIRGKEWHNGSMSVNGGIMASVLYLQEEDPDPRVVQTWIPFQMKWEFPATRHDGYVYAIPTLKSIDARSTSARKLMVRANLSLWGRAMVPEETEVYDAREVPQDVQVLRAEYPTELPVECGEVQVHVEEEVDLAAISPLPEKILRHDFAPFLTEQRVMASRLVFRGKGNLHLVYLSDGKVFSRDVELNFSQFADLDGEFSQAAAAQTIPLITNLEVEHSDGKLQLKCDMAAQYMIFDRVMVALTEDAYSNERAVTLQNDQLSLDRLLERKQQPVSMEKSWNLDADRIADVSISHDFPVCDQADEAALLIPGQITVLYYDMDERLQSSGNRFEEKLPFSSAEDVRLGAVAWQTEPESVMFNPNQAQISWDAVLDGQVFMKDGLWMVTGMELGDKLPKEEPAPSLILRRYTDARLWDTAKACRSTVGSILQANGLEEEPEKGRMILIPVS